MRLTPLWIITYGLLAVTNLALLGTVLLLSARLREASAEIKDFGKKFKEVSEQVAHLREMSAQARTADIDSYDIIHKRGDACPAGWKPLPSYFKESDGTSRDGCLNPRWNGDSQVKIDFLLSGESATMSVGIDHPARTL